MNIRKDLVNILNECCRNRDNIFATANKIINLMAEYKLVSCKNCKLNISCFGTICDNCSNYDMFEYNEK